VGLFWQTGHDDGMEFNINSRQTQDLVRGAPGFRPTLNSYLWADARAIARIARLRGDNQTADRYDSKAASLKNNLQAKLWDPRRQFFFPMAMRDEERDGHRVRALTLTHQSGRYAGSSRGRELIGYVPWQFGLPDAGFVSAWKFLMDPDYFFAPYGPTTVERGDPMFHVSPTCCWWSGQSWPYATTQTLLAAANLLNQYDQDAFSRADYMRLLSVYARTHRKLGKPYIAEAAHPDTGSWEGHDNYNHSEHYFHSGFVDPVITGLIGLRPRSDNQLEVHPLAPDDWDYFALEDAPYRSHRVSIYWDRLGTRYGLGPGMHLLVDGAKLASKQAMSRMVIELPGDPKVSAPGDPSPVNFAVNNDGYFYPRVSSSLTRGDASISQIVDGNYWYHASPPNRWTVEGPSDASTWCELDLGAARRVHTVKLYLLDDGPTSNVVPPANIELETWTGTAWVRIPNVVRRPEKPQGRQANVFRFPTLQSSRLRAVLQATPGKGFGLSEFEIWGDGPPPAEPVTNPPGNLAVNPQGTGFPKASASWTSRFDNVAMVNDGRTIFRPTPHNRWTAYESPRDSDWLEIDFGQEQTFSRVELFVYDDRGGVQAPQSHSIQIWDGARWKDVVGSVRNPPEPTGGRANSVTFSPVTASKMRAVFVHKGKSRSGLTEIAVWR
jgi:hypothetical protein